MVELVKPCYHWTTLFGQKCGEYVSEDFSATVGHMSAMQHLHFLLSSLNNCYFTSAYLFVGVANQTIMTP